ncbi:NAD-dependent epimerase/dehydratase family protein [Saccharopolyspora rosea]|uniref:NAD-dependent epimerase/dehydratase family protein n=1 Tax=Saccharopolyspora rosea TaxID=524884 RepID=A0ABW3FQ85_9PSEU|nr:NAD-dependent epimerase/dehydratase family protein [Saccharopolyspora rosea]
MQIIGHGFVAHHLAGLADRHEHVVVIAAGVSRTTTTSRAEFDREARLVRDVVRRCGREGRLVVFLSTASAGMYGSRGSPGTEDGPHPTSAYARHKLAMEAVVTRSRAPWLVLRLSHLVGTRHNPAQLVPALVRQVRSGSVVVYRGAYRDLLDVRHMLHVLDRLLALRVAGQVVNVASGRSEPVERIVDGIERRLGVTARRTVVDAGEGWWGVSIDRLRALVPEVGAFGFDADYLPALLDRYVPATPERPVTSGANPLLAESP